MGRTTIAMACVAAAISLQTLHAQSSTLRRFTTLLPSPNNEWGLDLIDVEAVGADVRLRVIRVGHTDEFCPIRLVQAVERTIPNTTVRAVVGVSACDVSQREIDRAAARSHSRIQGTIDFLGWNTSVVRRCGDRESVVGLSAPPLLDFDTLRRHDAAVWALINAGDRLRRSFAADRSPDPFAVLADQGRRDSETLGTSLVPRLVAGEYHTLLRYWCRDAEGRPVECRPTFLAQALAGYAGPPQQRASLPVAIDGIDPERFLTLVMPERPPIALRARISGDVRLRITAEPTTGRVDGVEVIQDQSLFRSAAVGAVTQWQFSPGSIPDQPVEVTFHFGLRCPADSPAGG